MQGALGASFRSMLGSGASADLPEHLRGRANFQAAARHSRRVKFLRRAIPLACILILAFAVLRGVTSFFFNEAGAIGAARIAIEGRKIVMEKPHLSGFKRDGSSYEMTADKSVQDLKEPNIITMNGLKSRIQTGSEGWAYLSGETGIYDTKAEMLNVKGNVRVKTDSGTEALLQDAHIEFKGGIITTQNPAEVKNQQGRVTSERMQVLDNGRRLVFEGNVKSIFTNADTGGEKAAAAEGSQQP